MAEIRFEGVKKQFKDSPVIEGLDLTIKDGEFFTFVGPSGCGKSTILNMLAGLEMVTEGRLYFDNQVVNDLSPKERDVAMVFQSYALYPHMTVYENMAFPLQMKKVMSTTIAEEVKRIALLLGLEEMLYRKPGELSGGQRQRVALGRAIIRRPKVFLMDEPLSNLDARLRVEMRAELKRLHQELKITTIYVTHDQAEALSLSERIAVVHKGEVQQCGTPPEVYLKPSNTFVAGFIGSPPMNFIPSSAWEYRQKDLLPPLSRENREGLIIGIRPEDVLISPVKSDDSIEVPVVLIEPAGSFNWIDVSWNNVKVKGKSEVDAGLKPGSRAYINLPLEKILLFDADSKRAI
ncbi:MAG: ABC transporter ATP-binding protein [Nitrospirae bacterium]|nr:ABC transporter ATP-binding protein [Nitrospirota bacterium]